jgi:hypothetical protein
VYTLGAPFAFYKMCLFAYRKIKYFFPWRSSLIDLFEC